MTTYAPPGTLSEPSRNTVSPILNLGADMAASTCEQKCNEARPYIRARTSLLPKTPEAHDRPEIVNDRLTRCNCLSGRPVGSSLLFRSVSFACPIVAC